jgi:aspartate ammonia-lyase
MCAGRDPRSHAKQAQGLDSHKGRRRERDLLGSKELSADALIGIHSARYLETFVLANRPVDRGLVQAYALVKLACARCNERLGYLPKQLADGICSAAREMIDGELAGDVMIDALAGGAGTAINMNVNEVLANRALQLLGRPPGDDQTLDPLAHVNLHQSTNDTFPTALRVAALYRLQSLEDALVVLVRAFQDKERELADVVKVGRTQLQDALLTTLGRQMGCYAEAFARDRWRLFKCRERLRVVNLGGTAIGSGFGAPRDFIFSVVDILREVSGLGLSRAENLMDATQNLDVLVEVSGMLKAAASNLLKVAGDLRLSSSGPDAGFGEIGLPAIAAGSSMMPAKVNPSVPEAVMQAAMTVIGNDHALCLAASMGNLELNAFMPLVADLLLENLRLLEQSCGLLARSCVQQLVANAERCRAHVEGSAATLTALIERLGHQQTHEVARVCRERGVSVREVVVEQGLMSEQEFEAAIAPSRVTRLGLADGGH